MSFLGRITRNPFVQRARQTVMNAAAAFGIKRLLPRFDGGIFLYVARGQGPDYGPQEGVFKTSDGRQIPIFAHYRYTVKVPTPTRALAMLFALEEHGLLSAEEQKRLSAIKGTRTVTEPLENQVALLRQIAARMPDLFLPERTENPDGPVLRQSDEDVRRIVDIFEAAHKRMLKLFAAGNLLRLKPGAPVLEIGYVSGAHSIFAFERLGLKAYGIDSFYDGLQSDSTQWEHNRQLLRSAADFRLGDITRPTSFEPDSIDMIYSSSVMEHIQDIPAALAEMRRILKPGGALVHNYHPYFCADGGHVLGVGDAPWAHVRMTPSDFIRYAQHERPFEAEAVRKWFAGALQFDMSQWRMQRLVAEAGFRIAAWLAKPSGNHHMKDLTPDVIRDCFAATPNIGIEDLVSRSVTFIAIKQD